MANRRMRLAEGSRWEGRCIVEPDGTSIRIVYTVMGPQLRIEPIDSDANPENVRALFDSEGLDKVRAAARELREALRSIGRPQREKLLEIRRLEAALCRALDEETDDD